MPHQEPDSLAAPVVTVARSRARRWPAVLALTDEVATAIDERRPIVALETSVLSQGLPPPHNLESAYAMERAVRDEGAIPAWTALDGGRIRLGLDERDLERWCDRALPIAKVARRDIPAVLARGTMGATTVSATLWIAAHAGIDIMATGGIGGVHPHSGDVSADLLEMARLPGLVVCAGPKSIVDPAATLERLEELGVLVVGYATSRLPFFLVQATRSRARTSRRQPGRGRRTCPDAARHGRRLSRAVVPAGRAAARHGRSSRCRRREGV